MFGLGTAYAILWNRANHLVRDDNIGNQPEATSGSMKQRSTIPFTSNQARVPACNT